MREWLIRHPDFLCAFCCALAGALAAGVFDIGASVGAARALAGDADRLASEALGG